MARRTHTMGSAPPAQGGREHAPKQVGPGAGCTPPGAVTQEVLSPMHEQRSPEKSEEFARLDGAILGLLTSPGRRRLSPGMEAPNDGRLTDSLEVSSHRQRLTVRRSPR
jgi:hypothetical protein